MYLLPSCGHNSSVWNKTKIKRLMKNLMGTGTTRYIHNVIGRQNRGPYSKRLILDRVVNL